MLFRISEQQNKEKKMRDPLYFYGDEPYEADENAILIPKELVFTEAFAKLPGDAQILYFVMLEYLNDAEEKGLSLIHI